MLKTSAPSVTALTIRRLETMQMGADKNHLLHPERTMIIIISEGEQIKVICTHLHRA